MVNIEIAANLKTKTKVERIKFMTDLQHRKLELALIIGLIISMLLTPMLTFGKECSDVSDQVLRLHIRANSNSEQDQWLKILVRNAILEDSAIFLNGACDLESATQLTYEQLDYIEQVANSALRKAGSEQTATAQLVSMFFNTRFYNSDLYQDFTMPAGQYQALQINIGTGEGNNWWCVMFPPMCVDAALKDNHDEQPAAQAIHDINTRPNYQMAFATVELIETIVEMIRTS